MAKAVLSDKEYQTLSQFRYQLRRFLRFSEQASRRHGITHLQYLLLLHIRGTAGSESATVGELAEKLQAHHHGVVALITRCEKEGWVIRRQGRTDRREVEVLLTAQGKRLLGKVAQLHRDELLNLEGSFRVPEVQDLLGD